MTLEELGQSIKERREECNLSIDEVAIQIKVSSRVLRAIEEGNRQFLPHSVYARGFIRSYASLVGYDEDELNTLLKELFPEEDDSEVHTQMSRPLHFTESNKGRYFVISLVIVCFLAGLCWGAWLLFDTYKEPILELIKKPFSANVLQFDADASPQANIAAGNSSLTQNSDGLLISNPTVSVSIEEKDINTAGEDEKDLLAVGEEVVSPVAPTVTRVNESVAEQEVVNPSEAQLVEIQAREDCYLGITVDDQRLVHHMLKANENYAITFKKKLKLLVGNSGGISLQYNGKDLGVLGERAKARLFTFPL